MSNLAQIVKRLARRRKEAKQLPTPPIQKGDDERLAESHIRAEPPKNLKGNNVFDFDPGRLQGPGSKPPNNEPNYGLIVSDEKQNENITEDENALVPGPAKSTDPDDVAHAHADHKTTVPYSGKEAKDEKGEEKGSGVAAQGYLGMSNLENGDILGAAPSGYSPSAIGNAINPEKGIRNAKQDTMRPMYGMASPMSVIPSPRDQIKSDLMFEDFSIVPPGNGLGVTNKMFLMEEARDRMFVYREPLALPRRWDGPTDLPMPPPIEWQNDIPLKDRKIILRRPLDQEAREMVAAAAFPHGSLNLLGDDYGFLKNHSDKGLVRYSEGVTEPVLMRPTLMERVRPPTGQQLQARKYRRLFDAARWPEHFDPVFEMSGGSTATRQQGYTMLPFPVGAGA